MYRSNYEVVLIDDDKDLLEILSLNLSDEFRVNAFTNPGEAMGHIEKGPVHAVVLDYHMPGSSAHEVYIQLRSKNFNRPILMLTGDRNLGLKLDSLDLGVDDFLNKPISCAELSAHLRNRIKSFEKKSVASLKIKNLEVNMSDPMVLVSGRPVTLTPKEFQILSLLISNPNRVIGKEEMVQKIWPDVKIEFNNVDTHLSNIRKKLGPIEFEIKTLKSIGYIVRL